MARQGVALQGWHCKSTQCKGKPRVGPSVTSGAAGGARGAATRLAAREAGRGGGRMRRVRRGAEAALAGGGGTSAVSVCRPPRTRPPPPARSHICVEMSRRPTPGPAPPSPDRCLPSCPAGTGVWRRTSRGAAARSANAPQSRGITHCGEDTVCLASAAERI
eukprot:358777-Chlamydomonas_euryale.AAC.4